MIRAFVAVELPAELQKGIAQTSASLQKSLHNAIRWVAPQNIHLTLKFFGDVSPASLAALTDTLTTEASHQPAFEMSISGFGVFPNLKRPRVLWIGVQAPPELAHLLHAIEISSARLGYPTEENKPFSPHLTIGRVREGADLAEIYPSLQNFQIGHIGTIQVNNIHLYRSDLRPQGPIYTQLASIALAQETP